MNKPSFSTSLYSIPGRDARLSSMAVRADEMLLIYDDEKARMWDMRTQELRRSVGTELAKSLLEDGTGWWSYYPIHAPGNEDSASSKVLSKIASARHGAIATLLTDYRRAIEVASRLVDPPASQYANATDEPPLELAGTTASRKIDSSIRTGTQLDTAVGKKVVTIIRPLLATVLPHSDALARNFSLLEKLRLGDAQRNWNVSCGIFGPQGSLARPILSSDLEGWQLSPTLTTHRLLVAIGLLKVLANITEIKDEALQLIQFLTHELPAELPGFKELSLPLLSRFILDSNQEIQEASRLLFSSCLQRLPDQQLEWLCEEWHELLPCKQPPIPADDAPVALLMLGLLAAERYKSLNPRLLKDISTSISIYICDEARPTNQAIAIELCHRGFDIWQHYLDAMEVVRTLFSLATNKESNTVTENRAAARLATLQIATANTPLFMTTLSLDILHARSPSHCSATMRLVAFMVRRKPLILYPNLPRLAEAVVKSLDPTITSMREAVVQAATVMINELVSTYPSIAFHGRLQRLAVGTHEGAVIMYDLKTATRLYVIEGHRRQLTGCSFSPDGRRLVTISLDERKLLIWKVGSGFTSMFSPGTIPRQGGADSSGAYKAIDFNVGDATSIDPETILNSVSFDWQNDRSVHVKIGEARVNLSVN
ncbi:hypothetical protein IE53DRAFT_282036 [Violaceomyces palustris]|uniref:Uncharacterized protein n=1 Tax=Violaceomyces palustris TaxID=1673888 RepID=A0ACD0P375_9BASI|nr:hypothetical protein IE53DRAFT_282036 [Violaceomyces palustris]